VRCRRFPGASSSFALSSGQRSVCTRVECVGCWCSVSSRLLLMVYVCQPSFLFLAWQARRTQHRHAHTQAPHCCHLFSSKHPHVWTTPHYSALSTRSQSTALLTQASEHSSIRAFEHPNSILAILATDGVSHSLTPRSGTVGRFRYLVVSQHIVC
jgi:hypothetical protein